MVVVAVLWWLSSSLIITVAAVSVFHSAQQLLLLSRWQNIEMMGHTYLALAARQVLSRQVLIRGLAQFPSEARLDREPEFARKL